MNTIILSLLFYQPGKETANKAKQGNENSKQGKKNIKQGKENRQRKILLCCYHNLLLC